MDDVQRTWDDYYERKKQERIREASKVWAQLRTAGTTDSTLLALDFVHFGNSRSGIEALARQLSEHYEVRIASRENEAGYWLLEGTTRPYAVTLTEHAHLEWVEFMADVARSHGCVFSGWVVEAPSLSVRCNSEDAEDAG